VLAKMEEEESDTEKHGHVTSLSVLRTHRKCGLATALMNSSHTRMKEAFNANFSALHVRETNQAAFHLYSQTLAYEIHEIERAYYADGEDAYDMRKYFRPKTKPSPHELEANKKAAATGSGGSSGGGGVLAVSEGAPALADPDAPPPPPDGDAGGDSASGGAGGGEQN